jgi:hypothetical protein
MPTSSPRVHYAKLNGDTACGSYDKHEITARPTQVTCARCKQSRAYRDMMEPER